MIDDIIADIFNKLLLYIKSPKIKKKINNELLEPLFINIYNILYPYVSLLFIMYILNLVLIIIILILIIIKKSHL
jgi:hypothetical protein